MELTSVQHLGISFELLYIQCSYTPVFEFHNPPMPETDIYSFSNPPFPDKEIDRKWYNFVKRPLRK